MPAPHGPTPTPTHQPQGLAAPSKSGAWMQVGASLLWLPQAAVLAWSIQAIQLQRPFTQLLWAAALFVLLGLVRSLLDAAGLQRAFVSARRYTQQLRQQAMHALAQHSPIDIQRPSAGTAASVLNEQADHITPYLARYTTARLKMVVVPLVIVLCVACLSWVSALVLLVAAPLIPLFMALVGWRAEAASKQHLQEVGNLNQFLLDRLQGITSIRGLGAVPQVASQLTATAERLRSNTMAVLKIAFLSSAVLELFSALGVALVAVYVGFHLLGELPFGSWGSPLSLAQAMFVLLLAPAFFEPLREVSAVWHDKAAGTAAEAALQALQRPGPQWVGTATDASAPTQPADTRGASLAISNLCFTHAGASQPVINGFNATIAPGETIALWGGSGSGKSSLLALMAGLCQASAGHIHINGQPMDDAHANSLRSHMAWLSQQSHVFATSMANNIRMGRTISDGALQAAINTAALQPVVAQRGNAMVGDGGLGLSGGEALRLALARAAATPHCQLILADEPTAHLDADTAHAIRTGLLALASQGCTLVVATHDPLLAARMGRVLSLDGSMPSGTATGAAL